MAEPTQEQIDQWNLSQIKQTRSRLHAKPIGTMIRRLMSQRGYGQTQAVDQLEAAWKEAAGPTLGKVSKAGKISRGVLTVFVNSSSSLQELHLAKRQLVASLNQALPGSKITDIRGRVEIV